MRKLIYLLILTFGLISCNSEDDLEIDNSQLVGKWNWISTCGGFTGDCGYPSEDNYETLQFTEELYIEKSNGVINIETSYTIVDRNIRDNKIFYEIELENESAIRVVFINGNLSIEGGDFRKEYERIQ